MVGTLAKVPFRILLDMMESGQNVTLYVEEDELWRWAGIHPNGTDPVRFSKTIRFSLEVDDK